MGMFFLILGKEKPPDTKVRGGFVCCRRALLRELCLDLPP